MMTAAEHQKLATILSSAPLVNLEHDVRLHEKAREPPGTELPKVQIDSLRLQTKQYLASNAQGKSKLVLACLESLGVQVRDADWSDPHHVLSFSRSLDSLLHERLDVTKEAALKARLGILVGKS